MAKVLVIIPAYNEANRFLSVVFDAQTSGFSDVLLVDDGSTDRTRFIVDFVPFNVVSHQTRLGVGAAIRTGLSYAIGQNYDITVIMNATGKTPARFIPDLVKPIVDDEADLVQGSRYLGRSFNVPLYRKVGHKIHTWLFWLATGRKLTDTTSGFRAIRLSMLKDERFYLSRADLDSYELEPYLLRKAVELGYRVKEVPVDIVYPKHGKYTKMRAVLDWWRIVRPLLWAR